MTERLDENAPPPARSPVRLYLSVAVIGVAVWVAGVAMFTAIRANHDSARSAQQLASQIQAERKRSVVANCTETNRRHDDTLRQLDVLLERRAAANPGWRKQLRESRSNTTLLIEALAPKRDCQRLLRESVGTTKAPPK